MDGSHAARCLPLSPPIEAAGRSPLERAVYQAIENRVLYAVNYAAVAVLVCGGLYLVF